MPPILRRTVLCAATLVVCLGLFFTVRAQGPATHNVTLRAEQISRGDDGRLVITAASSGDLRGALTLTITGTGPNGAITSGEWALVSTYIQDVLAEGHTDSDGHHEDLPGHHAGELLVQRGTLSGKITGGTLTFDADGRPSALGYIQLAISQGSLTFAGVESGTASLALNGLTDPVTSSGAAAFTF